MFGLTPYSKGETRPMSHDVFDAFDRFFEDDFFNNRQWPMKWTANDFKVDVKDEEAAYVIEADLPGVAKEDVSVEYRDNRLLISVDSKSDNEEEKDNYLRRERYQTSMQRAFYLKDIDAKNIEASMNDGVLKLNIPKLAEVDTSHRIEIK